MPFFVVSIQNKESLGEQHSHFCIFEGTEDEALAFGMETCIDLAHSDPRRAARCVPWVRRIQLKEWQRTSQFRGYADDYLGDALSNKTRKKILQERLKVYEELLELSKKIDNGKGLQVVQDMAAKVASLQAELLELEAKEK